MSPEVSSDIGIVMSFSLAHFAKFCLVVVLIGAIDRSDASDQVRRWTGAEHFAIPLHDWSRGEGGDLIAQPVSYGAGWRGNGWNQWTRLYKSQQTIGSSGEFLTKFQIHRVDQASEPAKRPPQAGIWLGLKSQTPSPRNVWTQVPADRLFIGLGDDGSLSVGETQSQEQLDPSRPIAITIGARLKSGDDRVTVTATPQQGDPITLQARFPAGTLTGDLCLVARAAGTTWNLGSWVLQGDAVIEHPDQGFGPILWTQYTLQDQGILKLQAQMVPLEPSDPQRAMLQMNRQGTWVTIAESTLEPDSSSFLFKVHGIEATEAIRYRVRYQHPDGDFAWTGTIRANPKDDQRFRVGVFNCDHGELFAQDRMVANVTLQDPDLLFFAGDQIYENMDHVQIVREPFEGARLSYLGKWYQFGLTWRSLLKNRPSVIIPDDHDVFMGNVWGDSGRGYVMLPKWVNMVQRTQTGSLPDPVDPTPLFNGIGVYFTALDYAGMSFAIIEDRKFKSQPQSYRFGRVTDPKQMDVAGATLLGPRQLQFLAEWTARTETMPARFFLSQTMMAKANTNTGSNLKRNRFDTDSNGWPQSGRKRALNQLGRDTIMIHGDQHIGILARMGIDAFDDGPLAFMVTGSSVGFPRAWWPEQQPEGGLLGGRPYTGRYFDGFGNRITVHAVTNPERLPEGITDARQRPDYRDQGVYAVQDAKGSGHGMVVVDKSERTARFEAYRLDFDAADPKPTDQFFGFPITLPLR